jgi:hypothetical protein
MVSSLSHLHRVINFDRIVRIISAVLAADEDNLLRQLQCNVSNEGELSAHLFRGGRLNVDAHSHASSSFRVQKEYIIGDSRSVTAFTDHPRKHISANSSTFHASKKS